MRRAPRPPQADHHPRTRYMDGLPGLARERAHRSAVALASPSSRARARALSHRRIDAGTGADTGVAELQTAVHPRDGARSPDCSSSGRVQRAQGGDAPARERVQTLAVRSSAAGCSAPARRCNPDCSLSGRAQRAQGGGAPTRERVRGAAVHPRGGARSPDCSSPGRAQRARVGDAGTGAGADGAGARAPGVSGRVSSVSVRPV